MNMNDALRAALRDDPPRDDAGRFAAPSTPLEAFAQAHGARNVKVVARLLDEDGVDPADGIAALRARAPELFQGPGSADGGASGDPPGAHPKPVDIFAQYRMGL
jgi:hypothetical protein